MNDKKKLERQIQVYSFAAYETALYLDGHKCDAKAIDYYNKVLCRLKSLEEKYESIYGPLTIHGHEGDGWKWTEGPWPWEYEAN